ncbi:uncharacterized protein LOC128603155 [Ictalurus furcatus]|uniref:uncharacterized protein LOC128603155 n=1 Tax=Ictalurus furcatus TaxID=66913 RepID=UPI0023505BCB|nr:uncharacterized protein LOC128603155 [Ictalurus furcatus]
MEQIIQQLSMDEKNNECLESDNKKENILLHIHLAMVRDMCLDEKGEYPQKLESECVAGITEDDTEDSTEDSTEDDTEDSTEDSTEDDTEDSTEDSTEDDTEDSTEDNTEDTFSVDEVLSKSKNYCMTWCTYTKQCETTSVCQSIIKHYEKDQILIQSLGHTIVQPEHFTPRRRRKACMNNYNYDSMTIYYYKSNIEDMHKGQPVILNFSGSNRFLKCMYKDDKAVLTVENWEQDKLKSICKSDKTTWPFVFFLTTQKDTLRRFESAACRGWYIHTRSGLAYACTRLEEKVEENTFIIFPSSQL